jgi:spermidine synthase
MIPEPPSPAPPRVVTAGNLRTLEFAPGNVQSAMDLRRPERLVLAYTRAMVLFALFVPHPRHIVLVGLGGGSLVKFCYRRFPQARITVVEIRADVIALRGQFALPPDDARLRVVHADAIDYLAGMHDQADVLLVDGFDAMAMDPGLGSARFAAACRRVLADGGVLAMNIFSYEPAYPDVLRRLRLMFGELVCWFDGTSGNNRILFAVKAPFSPPPGPPARALRVQAWAARRQGRTPGWWNRILVRVVVALAGGALRQHY